MADAAADQLASMSLESSDALRNSKQKASPASAAVVPKGTVEDGRFGETSAGEEAGEASSSAASDNNSAEINNGAEINKGPRHDLPGGSTGSGSSSSSSNEGNHSVKSTKKLPTVIINVGMAGSGKSTFMHRMCLSLLAAKKKIYAINLDPAVKDVRYPCAIDIRDTINYKEVMKHFRLGPNGAIMTSLNLFATRFDQVDLL